MVHGYALQPNAWLVVSVSGGSLTCVSLFSPEEGRYRQIVAPVQRLEERFSLRNAMPPDHDEIHACFATLSNRDRHRTESWHFHWTCKLDGDIAGGFVSALQRDKVIAKTQWQAILALLA